jgi:hypothetical protein
MSIRVDEQIKNIFQAWAKTVHDINERYKTPRIKMTKGVKIALFALRVYLFILVILLFYKFFTIVYGH